MYVYKGLGNIIGSKFLNKNIDLSILTKYIQLFKKKSKKYS